MELLPVILSHLKIEKGFENWVTGKKNSSSFYKEEDNGFHKLLIYEFCISQKQNSRVDQMHVLWAFMRGSGYDQGLMSSHGKHLF